MTDMNGWWTTLAWVIVGISLAWPVLYFAGAAVGLVVRAFRRDAASS
jgi:hypothetical protein